MSCPDCTTGGFLPGEPTGTFSTQGAYFAPAPAAAQDSRTKRAVLLLTDAFGLPLKNSKIIADDLAKRLNCDVWIPDYFEGIYTLVVLCVGYSQLVTGRPLIPLDHFSMPDRAGVKFGVFDWLKLIIKTIPRIPAFLASRPGIVDDRLSKVHTFRWLIEFGTRFYF